MWNLVYADASRSSRCVHQVGRREAPRSAGDHGASLGQGVPNAEAVRLYLAGSAEIALGILVTLGWQARIAAFALIAFVFVATLLVHNYWT